jgi:flagellin
MTNRSAIAALHSLRGTDAALQNTQAHISSGYRVVNASDNAAYWSISTTMHSDDMAMGAVQDALALEAATVDVAFTGMNSAIDIVTQFKSKLVAAREPGVDRDKVNAELTELRNQIRSIAESANFNGQNWLHSDDGLQEPQRELITGFVRSEDGSVRVTTNKIWESGNVLTGLIDETNSGVYGILTQPGAVYGWDLSNPNYVFMLGKDPYVSGREMTVDATTPNSDIDKMITGIEYMQKHMVTAAAKLGSFSSGIELQTKFIQDLRDATNRGIGRLRDADMNEESTRLKALQVQQQLGVQALSIANSEADNVVQLFRS